MLMESHLSFPWAGACCVSSKDGGLRLSRHLLVRLTVRPVAHLKLTAAYSTREGRLVVRNFYPVVPTPGAGETLCSLLVSSEPLSEIHAPCVCGPGSGAPAALRPSSGSWRSPGCVSQLPRLSQGGLSSSGSSAPPGGLSVPVTQPTGA